MKYKLSTIIKCKIPEESREDSRKRERQTTGRRNERKEDPGQQRWSHREIKLASVFPNSKREGELSCDTHKNTDTHNLKRRRWSYSRNSKVSLGDVAVRAGKGLPVQRSGDWIPEMRQTGGAPPLSLSLCASSSATILRVPVSPLLRVPRRWKYALRWPVRYRAMYLFFIALRLSSSSSLLVLLLHFLFASYSLFFLRLDFVHTTFLFYRFTSVYFRRYWVALGWLVGYQLLLILKLECLEVEEWSPQKKPTFVKRFK